MKNGEFAATVSSDPFWQGAMGLAIPYSARAGVFDPSKEPKDHREFYGTALVVTKDNVDDFTNTTSRTRQTLISRIFGGVQADRSARAKALTI